MCRTDENDNVRVIYKEAVINKGGDPCCCGCILLVAFAIVCMVVGCGVIVF